MLRHIIRRWLGLDKLQERVFRLEVNEHFGVRRDEELTAQVKALHHRLADIETVLDVELRHQRSALGRVVRIEA